MALTPEELQKLRRDAMEIRQKYPVVTQEEQQVGDAWAEYDAKRQEQTASPAVTEETEDSVDTSFKDLPGNVLPSAGRLIKDVGLGLVNIFNPNLEKNTVANLVRVGAGAVQKAIPGEQKQEVYADAVVDFFKERYGGIDQLKKTVINDPIGFVADAAAVLTGVGGALRGGASVGLKAAEVTGVAQKAGQATKVASGLTRVAETGKALTEVGAKVDPILQAGKITLPRVGKAVGGVGKGIVEGLTGIESDVMKNWFNTVKNKPEQAERALNAVIKSPQEPVKALVSQVGDSLTSLRSQAKSAFSEAIEVAKEVLGDKTFNAGTRVQELGSALREFNLRIKNGEVLPTTRTSPLKPREIADIQNLVDKLKIKEMTVPEILDFGESVRRFYDDAIRLDNKKLIAVGASLTKKSLNIIDDLLPEFKQANGLYRKYYEMMDAFGSKIIDSQGVLKNGAESFLSNIVNQNKGIAREKLLQYSEDIGFNAIDEVQTIRDAQKLLKIVPNTTRNRTADMIRGVLGASGLVGAAGGNFVPIVLLYLASSPTVYRTTLEILAGTLRSLPIDEAIRKIPTQELQELRNFLIQYSRIQTASEVSDVEPPEGEDNQSDFAQ